MQIVLEPIGFVRSGRKGPEDDNWGSVVSEIVVELGGEALQGIEEFSHAEILFYFDRAEERKIVRGARHPRDNRRWPRVGILAQRAKDRPNRLGLTTVRILKREGATLTVQGLDAIDGTPVLDIKPAMREFLPHGPLRQPEWAAELMKDYWNRSEET
ncbi:MAG: SAM-dependent methyltransferase [Bacteroidota bacterium]